MVGTGYVGLVTGVCFSNTGNDVVCLDIDPSKIDSLKRGECPIYEPGLTELMVKNNQAGRLEYTLDKKEAYRDAQIIFICVGTPTGKDGKTDMSYIWAAADDVANVIKELGPNQDPKVVVVKSTVPVGTTLAVKARIKAIVGDIPFNVANNPEFLKEGAAINDFNYPDRVCCGVENEATGDMMRKIYEPFVRSGNPIFVMDIMSSEMVKYASNNFLATKISFINEMANLCEAFGADVTNVRKGMCADSRIGQHFLYPGVGYGGSCFPKDTLACIAMGQEKDVPIQLSQAVHDVNQRQRRRFFQKLVDHFAAEGGMPGKTIAFWGMAFKPHTDDIREAPAVDMMKWAVEAGATVRAFDPVAAENVEKENPGQFQIIDDMYEAIKGADTVVISTDWDEFKAPDFDRMKTMLNAPVIFDGRNLYQRSVMADLNFIYHCIGRQPVLGAPAEMA
jgi:UDPglucose 6-dehydrogenase